MIKTVIIVWLSLCLLFAFANWLIHSRKKSKCNHAYKITSSIQLKDRVLLFLECPYCGDYLDLSILNKDITLVIKESEESENEQQ